MDPGLRLRWASSRKERTLGRRRSARRGVGARFGEGEAVWRRPWEWAWFFLGLEENPITGRWMRERLP
jgi:hypothetical protein